MAEAMATRDAYGQALIEVGARHPEMVVLDADLEGSTRTDQFQKHWPERFFDMGISEQDMMCTAAGLAASGKLVFASSFAIFGAGRAWEQIRNTIARGNYRVVIGLTHAGLSVGEDGASAQACEDLATMRVIPNMKVVVPADGTETKAVIRYLADTPGITGPTYVRMGRAKMPAVLPDNYVFQFGVSTQLRDGKDVTVIACGPMVAAALKAADELAKAGIAARVINMASIKPLDEAAVLRAAKETRGIVTAEEHSILGGLGGAVAEVVAEQHPTAVRRVGVRDTFGESGPPDRLFEKYGLTAANIVAAAKAIVGK
jgi:transketolase